MKNPMNRRYLREFKTDLGRYIAIFLFLVLLIGIVTSFMAETKAIKQGFAESIVSRNLEDGHLAFNFTPDEETLSAIEEAADLTLYPLSYFETGLDGTEATFRVYTVEDREEVNCIALFEGTLPAAADEIALDRVFAQNNDIVVGDTISLGGRELRVTGLSATQDYSCLFESNADMMFDSKNFTPALMTRAGFDSYENANVVSNYAWTYPEEINREDTAANANRSDDVLDVLKDVIKDYDGALLDQAIDAAKLTALSECLDAMEETYGDLSPYNTDEMRPQLLEMINTALDENDVDLTEAFSEALEEYPEKTVTLTEEDLKAAMEASDEEVAAAEDFLDTLEDKTLTIDAYLPRYLNKSINFGIDDVGSDSAFLLIFAYIVIAVIAFVFAITVSNTISRESGVIGTLRASGYSRGELVRHYMVLPIVVSLLGAAFGALVGYTLLLDFMEAIEFNSFSFVPCPVSWDWASFLESTLVPIVLMIIIDLTVLIYRLRLSPLRFLRHDLSRKGKKRALPLSAKLPFLARFRMRVIFQNIPNYLTLFVGIFLGGALVVFGLMFDPMVDDYIDAVIETRLADYQYVVMDVDATTDNPQAEKFAMTSLVTEESNFLEDEVSVYGIVDDSSYIDAEIPAGQVLVSNGIMEKYRLSVGDTYSLKDDVTGDEYAFLVAGSYPYDAALSIFMPIDEYRDLFDEDDDYFTGYFSNEALTDLDEDDIAATVTETDLKKLATQWTISMGDMMQLMCWFGVIIFLLLMYVLSKQIIEKNSDSIAMTKILGFKDREIGGLYIVASSIVVVLSLLVCIPIISAALNWAMTSYIYTEMSGYLPCSIDPFCYVEMFILGVASYAVVSIVQLLKIRRVPKSQALKDME